MNVSQWSGGDELNAYRKEDGVAIIMTMRTPKRWSPEFHTHILFDVTIYMELNGAQIALLASQQEPLQRL